jgi:hypothetical protein
MRVELTFYELDLIEKSLTLHGEPKPVASFRVKDRDTLLAKIAAAKEKGKAGRS